MQALGNHVLALITPSLSITVLSQKCGTAATCANEHASSALWPLPNCLMHLSHELQLAGEQVGVEDVWWHTGELGCMPPGPAAVSPSREHAHVVPVTLAYFGRQHELGCLRNAGSSPSLTSAM